MQRLRTILRLQRDEFLPLRVIRQELAAGRADPEVANPKGRSPDPRALRRATVEVRGHASMYRLAEVLDETGADQALVKELEEYGVIRGERHDGEVLYDETEREIVRAVTELKRFGVGGRNLRVFRTSADREAALLEQILAPALRSRNPERRKEAVEALENLAAIASHLKHLLLIRDLRKLTADSIDLRTHIQDIPDFPKPGIVFKDITPLFLDPEALRFTIDALAGYARERGTDYVLSAEARGFVLGGAVAASAGAGFVLARKPGKLPRETASVEYQLEYGVDALEMHADALAGGARVLVHDDLLATGGTAEALCGLVERAGAEVAGCAFVIELAFLSGRERLSRYDVHSLVVYE